MRKIRHLSFRRMFDRFSWIGIGIGIGDAGWWDKCVLIGFGRYSLIIGPHYDSQVQQRPGERGGNDERRN